MTSSLDPIRLPQSAASIDTEIDRAALALLLVEIARNVDPEHHARFDDVPASDHRMETLRQLLVGREISELSRVTHLLGEAEQFADAVGGVLPSATARAPHVQLGEALAPAVERAVQRSIQKSPGTLTDILYPVFLPAIRKSIGEKIDQTFQSLNETLRHIFTWHGLKWRFESWRTGASFSEVVLKHSLVYRVEHVFLINRKSGLLIAHVTADNATSEDPQLISSMLSAIQDFVKDSFHEKEQSGLDTIRFGELRLWSEVGPFATLVAVIRGNPPEELHEIVRDVLLRIHDEYALALEQFDGDNSQLVGIETRLQTCVDMKQEDSQQGFPWLVVAAVLLVSIPAAVWLFLSWQSGQRWQAYVSRLEAQAGIIVAEQKVYGGQFYISGLRDPLATDPQSLLSGTQVDPAQVHSQWQFYQSLEPEFVLKRLTASLAPPESVLLSIVQGRLVAEGEAPANWINRARAAAEQLSADGVVLDVSQLRELNLAELNYLREAIQATDIFFYSGKAVPGPEQTPVLDRLADQIKEFAQKARKSGATARFMLTGHADATGRETANVSISASRAETVRALLNKRGVAPELLVVRGAGTFEPVVPENSRTGSSTNRRVSITISLE
uniref:OmpA family protein n=1 Tax=uncultured Rhizobium sp. TaxID=155567 RepID=UPI00260F67CE|nr:OmpA family protein [uncultured Rhizobium sp.]